MKISLQNLSFSYQNSIGISRRVISNVTQEFTWEGKQQIAGMLLPYGGGKSSLMKIIAGLLMPDSGTCSVTGADAKPARAVYIPPSPVSAQWLSFEEQVHLLFPSLKNSPSIKETAELCGIDGYENHLPAERSIAFRLRIQIALAILSCAGVILLDDPFTALMPQIKDHLFSDLREIITNSPISLFFATSGLGDAAQLTDKLYIYSSLDGSLPEVLDTSSWTRDSMKTEQNALLNSLPSNIRY